MNSNPEIIEALIHAGADVNVKSGYFSSAAREFGGLSPLHMASWRRNPTIVNTLIQAGADINSRDEYERTALIYELGRIKMLLSTSLIKAGAIDAKDERGLAVLYFAICCDKNSDIVLALVQAGADVNAKDRVGRTIFCGLDTPCYC